MADARQPPPGFLAAPDLPALRQFTPGSDIGLALGVVALLSVLILPLPTLLLDLGLALSITAVGSGPDGGAVPQPAARLLQLPDAAAADHSAAPVAQRRRHPADPVARQRRPARRRPRGGGVRRLPDGRRRGDRADRLLDPAGGELHGHHQGLRPHRRGRRAVQPGRDARQADGDRRRPLRRPDRREGSAPPPPRTGGGKRLLRRHGRRREVRPRRCDRGADHHGDQHRGRPGDRPAAARHALRRRRRHLHHADRRRRPGVADPRAAGLHRRRHRGDQGRHGGHRRCRADPPARPQSEAAGDGGGRGDGAGAAARPADAAVPGARRPRGRRRLAALQAPAGRGVRRAGCCRSPPSSRSATRCGWT